MHGNKLNGRVKLVIPIANLAHYQGLVANLADIECETRASNVEYEIQVVNASLFEDSEFNTALLGIVERLSRVGLKSPGCPAR